MTIDFIDAASEQGTFAPLGEDERTWLRFLASQEARYIREQDDAAIEAEETWRPVTKPAAGLAKVVVGDAERAASRGLCLIMGAVEESVAGAVASC